MNRVGAVLALAGGVGFLVVGVLHGSLPQDGGDVLRHVAMRSDWSLVHLVAIGCALAWVGAFTVLARSLPDERSRGVGGLAAAASVAGFAAFIADAAIDGVALKRVADAWAATGQESLFQVGSVIVRVLEGTHAAFITWFLGLPFLLMGVAVVLGGRWRWAGWVGAVAGGATFLGGVTRYLGVLEVPEPVLFAGPILVSMLWLAATGVLLWRDS